MTIINFLNSFAGLLALGVAGLLAFVNTRLRAEISVFKIEVMNRDKAMVQELSAVFIRKPELTDDYPIGRREFNNYVRQMDETVARIRVDIVRLDAEKSDRQHRQ